jgi:CRP-like cAMP-binding protein
MDGMTTDSAAAHNRFLRALLRACNSRPDRGEVVEFEPGQPIYSAGDGLTHVYFPVRGVLSIIVQLKDGGSAEALSIGNEGFIGLPVWLGQKRSTEQVVQQTPGELYRMPARVFCRIIIGSRVAERLLKRFAIYSLRAGYQSTVCSTYHSVEQRAARWILTTADRARSPDIHLGQSLLAHMLGVRRPTVSEVASSLQRRGALSYRRKRITILDRGALEARACECYYETRALYREQLESLL